MKGVTAWAKKPCPPYRNITAVGLHKERCRHSRQSAGNAIAYASLQKTTNFEFKKRDKSKRLLKTNHSKIQLAGFDWRTPEIRTANRSRKTKQRIRHAIIFA